MKAFIKLAVELGGVIQTTDPERARARDRELIANPTMLRPITPRLGRGLHGDMPAPAGTRAAQPRLGDGTLLDDNVGYRFAVLVSRRLADAARTGQAQYCATIADVVIVTATGLAESYLAELHTEAVVIRPDRYILGVASTTTELDAVLARRLPPLPYSFHRRCGQRPLARPGDLHGPFTSSYQRGRSCRQPEAAARTGASLARLGKRHACF